MDKENLAALRAMAEEGYAAFQQKLVPDTSYPILGVRLPQLRRLARQKAREDWKAALAEPFAYYEQVLLAGLTIAYARAPLEEKLEAIWALLPRLDSWAFTDSIAPTLKVREEELPRLWAFAQCCLESPAAYTRRFGLILLLDDFLVPAYWDRAAEAVMALRDDRYYVQMAAAWLTAELAAQQFDLAAAMLRSGRLDAFTHNKAIQKMRESYRISPEQKAYVHTLKRKESKHEENHGN